MKRKKLILSESSLIDLIVSTVMEAIEDKDNPIETGEPNPKNQSPPNHYIDAEPDEGWDEFWLDFNGDDEWQDLGHVSKMLYGKTEGDKNLTKKYGGRMPLSDEEFLSTYKKSREDFKVDLRGEVIAAKNKAISYYKNLYHPDNETVVNKISKQMYGDFGERFVTSVIPKRILKNLQGQLDDIKKYKKHTLVHFSKKDMKSVGGSSPRAWGWVWGPVTGSDVYNMNLYNFTRPGLGSWKEKIYSTTIHELGHVIENLLGEAGVEAYQEMDDQDIEFKDKDYNEARKRIEETTLDLDKWKTLSELKQESWAKSLDIDLSIIGTILNHISWEKYVQRDSESYARLQQLRRVFGFTRDTGSPSAKEWVNMWMEKVNNGEITIGNDEQIGRQLYIPRNPLESGDGVKWGRNYTCKVQTFLLKHNYSVGSKERKNGKEVCDGGYGSATKKALRDFYKNMWSKSRTGTRVFITIPKEMVKWELGVENPRSYDEINDLTRAIYYNGEKKGDISSLLAKTAWDSGENAKNYELVLDFNEIAYYNDIFVDTESDLYLQYDDEDQGLEIDKTLRQT